MVNPMSNVQNELSSILPELLGQDYFLSQTISLPPKTLSAHGFSAITFLGASLYQKASSEHWHGRILQDMTNLFVTSTYVCNSFLATAEAVGTLVYALLVSSADALTGAQCGFFHNHVIKSWSYCVHSVVILAVQIIILYSREFPSHHSLNCLVGHVAQLLSSALVLGLYDAIPLPDDQDVVEREYAALVSAIRTFIECGPLLEFLYALNRDFGEGASSDEFKIQLQRQSVMNFFQHFPMHQGVFHDLGIDNFLQQAYRTRWRDMAADFVRFSYHPDLHGDIPEVHVVSSNNPKDAQYQNTLGGYIKAVVKEIYNDEALVANLSETGSIDEGRLALEGFWPQVYIPLANYAQLTELEASEVLCPETFQSGRLHDYDGRYGAITTARMLLQALSAVEKQVLVKELISVRSDIPEVSDKIKELYRKIGELSCALHKGTLMNMQTIESITGNSSSISCFQKSYMEAVEELAVKQ